MAAARVTPHQAEVLGRIARATRRGTRPTTTGFVGSRGAVDHLADKGYVTVTREPGAREADTEVHLTEQGLRWYERVVARSAWTPE